MGIDTILAIPIPFSILLILIGQGRKKREFKRVFLKFIYCHIIFSEQMMHSIYSMYVYIYIF